MRLLQVLNDRLTTDTKEDLIEIVGIYSLALPQEIVDFLVQYQGCQIQESWYLAKSGKNYSPSQFLYIRAHPVGASIEVILQGDKFYGYKNLLPFAIDPGGWVFNLSLTAETNGQVWIDMFDSGEKSPFEFVCDSFIEFVNGLQAKEP